jgi:DNA-binding NarL/FixJ family response regulator
MAEKKTILIVDDHPFFREGLKSLLARDTTFEIVGEAATGEECLRKVTKLRPDLVIMDISLPDRSGLEVTREIRRQLPPTRVIILSMHLKVDYVTQAFQSGATGYVTKEAATEKLFECLESVLRGDYFMDPSLHHAVVEKLMFQTEDGAMNDAARYSGLTDREQEILRLLAEGLSAKQIADKLFISQKTVENHRSNIMRKLDLHSVVELVRYAAKFGLIDVNHWKNP